MTRARLIFNSLRHHARSHVGTLLGAIVAGAVLTGSLAVGDSVKRTLQDQAQQRLGYIQAAIVQHDRFFRADLAEVIALDDRTHFAPILRLNAAGFTEEVAANSAILLVESRPEVTIQDEWRGTLPDPQSETDRTFRTLRLDRNTPPPTLSLTDLDGATSTLRDALPEGQTTLVNFWATWCGSCKTEMPELQALHTQGVHVMGVSLDRPADHSRVRPFLKQLGVTYPVFLANEDASGLLFPSAPELPLSLLIDAEGNVIDTFSGWNLKTQRRMAATLGK